MHLHWKNTLFQHFVLPIPNLVFFLEKTGLAYFGLFLRRICFFPPEKPGNPAHVFRPGSVLAPLPWRSGPSDQLYEIDRCKTDHSTRAWHRQNWRRGRIDRLGRLLENMPEEWGFLIFYFMSYYKKTWCFVSSPVTQRSLKQFARILLLISG